MYQRILVPIDGSEPSGYALSEAIAVARLTRGRMRLMHVIDELSAAHARSAYAGYGSDWLSEVRRDGAAMLEHARADAEAAGIGTETLLHDSFSSHLAEVVLDEASRWQADLIVLGTHGRRGISRVFMGSGAESILRSAKVPVLLVRKPDTKAQQPAASPVRASRATSALSIE
ncbi:MAG: universal stress protein UspA [Rhodoferax sp.]|nr:universal stress protein UspA [Rhodoferax sp.]